MRYEIKNDWHRGLLRLFGYMEPVHWNILWIIAREADEHGFCPIPNETISNARIMRSAELSLHLKQIKDKGLLRVAQKRTLEKVGGYRGLRELCPRVLQLYGGIKHGKLPSLNAAKIAGLMPMYHYTGHVVRWTTYTLLREKHLPMKVFPKYEDHGKNIHPNVYRKMRKELVPSLHARRRYAREKAQRAYERNHKKQCLRAREFYYMDKREFADR